MNRKEELENRLRDLEYHYYILGEPKVSDKKYEELVREYEEIAEEKWETIGPTPTEKEFEHEEKMLSLENVMTEDELVNWLKDKGDEFTVMPKYDGISLVAYYHKGRLTKVVTRGDGETGEDVTMNAKEFIKQDLRTELGEDFSGWIRGEAIMDWQTFEKYEENYSLPRHLVMGAVRTKKGDKELLNDIEFKPFDSSLDMGHNEMMERILYWGLVADMIVLKLDMVVYEVNKLEKVRDEYPYPIDGAVIRTSSREIERKLGKTSHHPKFMVAKKFKEPEGVTKIKEIEINVGANKITPVAILEPIKLDGSKIKRVSLHNQGLIEELNVNVGDRVRIHKSGAIIPEVIDVVEKESKGHFELPERCPACGTKTKRQKTIIYCPNDSCDGKLPVDIKNFVDVLKIDGIGEKMIECLIKTGKVTSVEDMFDLSVYDIASLEGFGRKQAIKVVEQLTEIDEITLSEYIQIHNIEGIGKGMADRLEENFKNLGDFNLNMDSISKIDKIGKGTEEKLIEYFKNTNLNITDHVRVVCKKQKPKENSMRFCITGQLSKPRSEIKKEIEKAGHEVKGFAKTKTDVLVVGKNPGSKKQKAEEAGIKIATEKEMRRLIERSK